MNQVGLNSQRFMPAAAGIDTTDALGPLKLQGAVGVFSRAPSRLLILGMKPPSRRECGAARQESFDRGEQLFRLADDVHALSAPFRAFFRAAWFGWRRFRDRMRERMRAPRDRDDEGRVEAAS